MYQVYHPAAVRQKMRREKKNFGSEENVNKKFDLLLFRLYNCWLQFALFAATNRDCGATLKVGGGGGDGTGGGWLVTQSAGGGAAKTLFSVTLNRSN